MTFRNLTSIITLFTIAAFAFSCEKDEGKNPEINFKTGTNYTIADGTAKAGSTILIGINAKPSEEKDPLISFNITKSVNGGDNVTVYNYTLQSNEQDNYSYDYSYTIGESAGDVVKFIFTVTNRDGLQGQKSIALNIE
ncbi:hypothetical protein GC194_04660 [bacterium]|nr:hypothetical protein [bacterium]